MLTDTVLDNPPNCNGISFTDGAVSPQNTKCNIDCNKLAATDNRSNSADFVPPLGKYGQGSTAPTDRANENYKLIAKKRFKMHRKAAKLMPGEKALTECCLRPAPFQNWITGNYAQETQSAFFGGLTHCDSPNCPLCAPRRAEQQRKELTVLLAEAQRRGLFAYHLTFTFSHSWGEELEDEHYALNKTLERMFAGGWFTRLQAEIGYVGRVRAYENTFGSNGWHFHAHIILLMELPPIPERLEADLFTRYSGLLAKEGYFADSEHGVRVEVGYSELADYVAKYGHDPILMKSGLEHEIAEFRSKKGKGSLTPFELLAASCGESEPLDKLREVTNGRYTEAQLIGLASELFIEHFQTMKGKPRLVWSKGLREALAMDEAMDWYNAQHPEPESKSLILLHPQAGWKQVTGTGAGDDLRPDLLAVLRTGDVDQVSAWCVAHHIEVAGYGHDSGGEYVSDKPEAKPTAATGAPVGYDFASTAPGVRGIDLRSD